MVMVVFVMMVLGLCPFPHFGNLGTMTPTDGVVPLFAIISPVTHDPACVWDPLPYYVFFGSRLMRPSGRGRVAISR